MKNIKSVIPPAIAALLGGLAGILGGFDGLMRALLICIGLDYLTGVSAAAIKQSLSSRAGFSGILKKLLILSVVALSVTIDGIFDAGGAVRGTIIGFFIANEGLSILENAAEAGLPIPQKLIKLLKGIQEEEK
jgi:toxin secretion/phage lysis holin